MREILNVSQVLVEIPVDVCQLDDVRGVAALEILGDDLAETLLSFAFTILKIRIKLEINKSSSAWDVVIIYGGHS